MQGGQGRRKMILTWSLLLMAAAMAVLGVFLWSWLQQRMSHKPLAADEGALQIGQSRNVSEYESPGEQEALDMVKHAAAVREPGEVARYFRMGAATPDEVVGFIKEMEVVDGKITGFQWLSSMDANGMLIDGVLVSTLMDGSPRNRLALLTPDEKGEWKIDFEAFARTVRPSWKELMEERGGTGLVRVIVAKDSYYNGPFKDESEWVSYGMVSPDSEVILLGYCRKGSPQARAMERIVSEEKGDTRRRLNRATLEVRRPEGAEVRQFEIIRVLAEDWILSGQPFDRVVE
ncbi:MAG: hypothetical protein Q8Q59_07485 [Luteolibacter sp.]|nr:hypothetical protein [Luteolibacter sp.]